MFELLFLLAFPEGADPSIWRGGARICDTLDPAAECEIVVSSEMYPSETACLVAMERFRADFRARARDGLTVQIGCVRQSRLDYDRERRRRGEFEA